MAVESRTVIGDDAGAFLAAMLQGMQPQGDVGRSFVHPDDAEQTALLAQLVVIEGIGRQVVPGGGASVHRVPTGCRE